MFASEQSTPPLALGPEKHQIHPLNAAFYGKANIFGSLAGMRIEIKAFKQEFQCVCPFALFKSCFNAILCFGTPAKVEQTIWEPLRRRGKFSGLRK